MDEELLLLQTSGTSLVVAASWISLVPGSLVAWSDQFPAVLEELEMELDSPVSPVEVQLVEVQRHPQQCLVLDWMLMEALVEPSVLLMDLVNLPKGLPWI